MNLIVRIPNEMADRISRVDPARLERAVLDAVIRVAEDDMPQRPHALAGIETDLSPQEAAARIIERRRGVTLGGLTIKDLINEGRP